MKTNLEPFAVSCEEAARLLGLSKPVIYQLANQSSFPSFKVGNRTLIAVDALREWTAKQAQGGVTNGT